MSKYLNTGAILPEGKLMMLKRIGETQGPNGKYELLVDQNGQMVVRSLTSMRKFLLSWQNVMEIAVDNGIDDRVVSDQALAQ